MNEWLILAVVLLLAVVPCGIVTVRGTPMEALVALELAGTLVTLALLVLAEGFHRQPFVDLAIIQAVLSFAGSVTFARFLERWV